MDPISRLGSTISNDDNDIISDNPCWGGPEPYRHDLKFLLSCIGTIPQRPSFFSSSYDDNNDHDENDVSINCPSRATTKTTTTNSMITTSPLILHECNDYLAVNKPPDLRMDGPYRATLHKLLTYLYPPPSLIASCVGCVVQKMKTQRTNMISKAVGAAITTTNLSKTQYDNISPPFREEKDVLDKTHIDTTNNISHNLFLQNLSRLSVYSNLIDNELRPIHQLDYATSGVLLIARNKRAASIACQSFQERRTTKEYLAIVHGHIADFSSNNKYNSSSNNNRKQQQRWFPPPRLPKKCLDRWKNGSEEDAYRKRRKDQSKQGNKKKTFVGFMPVHAIFQKWKSEQLRLLKQETKCSRIKITDNHDDGSNNIDIIEENDRFTKEEVEILVTIKWSDIKKNEQYSKWKIIFERMADRYNNMERSRKERLKIEAETVAEERRKQLSPCNDNNYRDGGGPRLPVVFCIEDEEDDSFYINASLSETDGMGIEGQNGKGGGSFRAIVDPSIVTDKDNGGVDGKKDEGNGNREKHFTNYDDNDDKSVSLPMSSSSSLSVSQRQGQSQLIFKPSLTRCVVLWRGRTMKGGHSVSKVKLQPVTGRRHQLRLHMALCGHAILGDATYETMDDYNNNNDNNKEFIDRDDDNDKEGRATCDRMCLHAHSLSIPLLNDKSHTFITPDPFSKDSYRDYGI